MNIEIIDSKEYLTSIWSGGTTTQLYIMPPDLNVKDDFDLRISSATVCQGESEFSDFNDYNRFLTILQGGMFIRHKDTAEQYLGELQSLFFDGATPTYSRADQDVIDFNIIWKKNIIAPQIKIIHSVQKLVANGWILFYSCADSRVILGGCEQIVSKGQLVKITANQLELEIIGKGVYCALSI